MNEIVQSAILNVYSGVALYYFWRTDMDIKNRDTKAWETIVDFANFVVSRRRFNK